jgi:hypothetical protein
MMSKTTAKMILVVAVSLFLPLTRATGQQASNAQQGKAGSTEAMCPLHDAHIKAHDDKGIMPGLDSQMKDRGESENGMRFSQSATTHHFLMKSNGGVIQVESNDAGDVASRGNIRRHLAHIAQAFANGDFHIPMFVHDTVPPGVSEMKRLRERIRYAFEETPSGGRVVITTPDKESLTAVHKFLRFQIEEHKTGDPTQGP